MNKLEAANLVLKEFASDTWIEHAPGKGWFVKWRRKNGVMSRRWQLQRGSDDYPVWYRYWAHGGTACRALAQLIRWLQGKPVLPLGTWKYWTGENIRLGSPKVIEILKEAGWPEQVRCVVCGEPMLGGLDWWRLGRVSGPCHTFGVCRTESRFEKDEVKAS